MAEVAVRRLCKSYGDQRVLDGISFEVAHGEFCVLLGPSGCGKTTLLRILAGLESHDSGSIQFSGADVGRLSPRERDVAMVFQSYALYPHLSVFENLAFPLKARRVPSPQVKQKVETAAELLGIADLLDRKPRALSGGQRQRVAIGRAIVRDPRVFLFDEPLSNLDAGLRSDMRQELARLHRKLDATIVYVTHDQVEAMTLGESVVLLNAGRIQQSGTPEDLYQRPANLFVARFIGSPAMNCIEGTLERTGGQMVFSGQGLTVKLDPERTPESLTGCRVTVGIRPESIEPGTGELTGRLAYLEDLGSEVMLHLEVGTVRLVARANRGWGGRIGDDVPFSLDESALHLFRDRQRVQGR